MVLRNGSDAPIGLANTVRVRQYASRPGDETAIEVPEEGLTTRPDTQPVDPRITAFLELWRRTPKIELAIEGPYTASYMRSMFPWNYGPLERVEVRPNHPFFKLVNLPGSMFQVGQYRIRAYLRLESQVLAESNTQTVTVTKRD